MHTKNTLFAPACSKQKLRNNATCSQITMSCKKELKIKTEEKYVLGISETQPIVPKHTLLGLLTKYKWEIQNTKL